MEESNGLKDSTVTPEPAEQQPNESCAKVEIAPNSAKQNSIDKPSAVDTRDEGVIRTRSGRISRRPKYLNDYYSH